MQPEFAREVHVAQAVPDPVPPHILDRILEAGTTIR